VGEEPKLGHETIIPVAYDNSYRMVTVSTRSLQAAAVSVHATTMPAITPAAVISARSSMRMVVMVQLPFGRRVSPPIG
jgi:hypothetical protein